ncbi:MAG: PTS system mannose/fructose/sorbose family transporter subunit IID [Gemmatimonadales bacterium]|nr:PTS system mannose/fructose/sorbose family transporter subunit IID [Gemmatimonadales bacterium]
MLRLFAVQGTWNYERMLGVGMGYAAEPLLEDLKAVDPVRHGEAVARSAEFFNCNPNLAGLALGAVTRAEYEDIPGPQIARLRTALCSPLGAMGDELFWAGLVPALMGAALVGVVLGAGWWAIAGFILAYNGIRLWTSYWSLRLGMQSGMRVGSAIGASWLPRAIELIGPVAAFTIGAALPLVAAWYLTAFGWPAGIGAAGVTMAGIALTRWFAPFLTPVRFALAAMIFLVILRRVGV